MTVSFMLQHRKLCRNIENYVATKFSVATEKLCRVRENSVATSVGYIKCDIYIGF